MRENGYVIECETKITIHILPNILRRKGNQTMNFGQLIENNKRKSYTKCGGEARPRCFYENSKLSNNQQFEML